MIPTSRILAVLVALGSRLEGQQEIWNVTDRFVAGGPPVVAHVGRVAYVTSPAWIHGTPFMRYGGGLKGGGFVVTRSGNDGHVVSNWIGTWGFGASLAGLGDVDGDGWDDFAVGSPFELDPKGVARGAAWIFYGNIFGIPHAVYGPVRNFGSLVASVGDVDQDGIRDLLVGSPAETSSTSRISLLSAGKKGALVRTLVVHNSLGFGIAGCDAGDVDGDGTGDLLIGDPLATSGSGGVGAGTTTICSGSDLSILRTYDGGHSSDAFGSACTVIGDIDGDGVRDHAVAAPHEIVRMPTPGGGIAPPASGGISQTHGATTGSLSAGRGTADGASIGAVHVFSGATGARLAKLDDSTLSGLFATSICDAGDVDLDGTDDVLVGFSASDARDPFVNGAWLYSGSKLTPLYRFECPHVDQGTVGLASLGDANGDGRADVMVGALGYFAPRMGGFNGSVRAFSGAELYLSPNLRHPQVQDRLELATALGLPGNPVVTVVVAVNGVATFLPIEPIGTFDRRGRHVFAMDLTAAFGPLTIAFQSIALDRAGRLAATAAEEVEFP